MSPARRESARSQQERSAATRAAAMDAALLSLEANGYAGTTTLAIQKLAGLSRGRLLHQFASKSELLIAAVQRMAQSRFEELHSSATADLPTDDRIRKAIELLWQTHQGGLFWVATELWLAARLDAELRAALLPEERRLGKLIRQRCDELFGPDVVALPNYRAFREVLISSMRGIALTYSFDQRDMETEPLLTVWCHLAVDWLGLHGGSEARSRHEGKRTPQVSEPGQQGARPLHERERTGPRRSRKARTQVPIAADI